MMEQPTPQETEALFFESNLEAMFPWWRLDRPTSEGDWGGFKPQFRRLGDPEDGSTPDGWSYIVHVESPDGPDPLRKLVNHQVILSALRRTAADEDMTDRPHRRNPDPEVAANVRAYLEDPNPAHMDADAIDEVLQVAVHGGVVYR